MELLMADKIAIALCVIDNPSLNEYLAQLEYAPNSVEGISYYNLGKGFAKEFISLGFTREHLSEILKETDCEY